MQVTRFWAVLVVVAVAGGGGTEEEEASEIWTPFSPKQEGKSLMFV